ncbi:MAG: hypothetical protein II716_06005, partial [Treponema sp.]|nr:hypothetical protein [Treponema sp.]
MANVLAVLSTNISGFPMPKSETLDLWEEFLGRHEKIISSVSLLCYFIPVILCVLYSMKAFRRKPTDKEYIKVRVHIPGAFALRGIAGWICNLLLETVFLIYFKTQHNVPITSIVIPSLASYIFLSMFSFTLTYFTLETLNRNVVLPEIYPDGNISGTERMSVSS